MEQSIQIANSFRITETNKADRERLVLQITESIDNGEVDVMKLHSNVKNTEALIKLLSENKTYKDALLEAAQKAGKGYEVNNAKFEVKEAGVKYDYSQCNDPVMDTLLSQQEELKKKIEVRSGFLKSVPVSGIVVTDESSGETTTLYPPSKTSTTTVQVTLK